MRRRRECHSAACKEKLAVPDRKDQSSVKEQIERQVQAWSGVSLPNAAAAEMAEQLASVMRGFEELRGSLQFEDEPSSFEAALQATKER